MRHGVLISMLAGALSPALLLMGPVNALFGAALFGMIVAVGSRRSDCALAGNLILSIAGLLTLYSPVFVGGLNDQATSLFLGGLALCATGAFGAMRNFEAIRESDQKDDRNRNPLHVTSLGGLDQVA